MASFSRIINLGITLGILWPLGAAAGHFQGGSHFEAIPLRGDLHLVCDNGDNRVEMDVPCNQKILEPQIFDYFELDEGEAAEGNWVTLTAVSESGEVSESSRSFSSQERRSYYPFNLWDKVRFKGALLDVGLNRIRYSLKDRRSGVVHSSGDFELVVGLQAERACAPGTYTTEFMDDCKKLARACREYFARSNYCR